MSKSSQDEGAAESVAQEAPSGGTPKKTPADIYENPGGSKKIIRVLTVLAYMFSVSFVGILLSAYYVFLWQPPNPRLLHKAHIQADPQFEFLVGTQPASFFLVANRTKDSDDKTVSSGEDPQEAVQKVTTFAPLKSSPRKFNFYPSSSIDRNHMNHNKSEDRSHRVKQDAGMSWRSSRVENLTDSKYQSRVSLGNILQRSTVKTQNINRTNETFNTVAFVKEKNESTLPVTFLNNNDENRRINEIKVNFTSSDDFSGQSLKNSSSRNLTFNQLDEPEESSNEIEVNIPEDLQEDLPNPAHSEENEIIGSPDVSLIEPKIITKARISEKSIEESTNDWYTEIRNVSMYSIETLVNRTKTTESSRMDDLMMSSTESTQSVVPLQNDLKVVRHPEDTTWTETTSETIISTFGTARTESEDSTENSETIDKNR
ncbi:uncharacterized protein LOC107264209 [Cephus cinctus]|uniref:Uncharacterized protein LOC107264209 n=1 Tax=Cephus cinctus TaxID=211228 RepID=A0AAJ7RAM2_CEPCN|nr:uncharacterized protein LOC107264209 [Cephus cinctus]XP_024937121.1 uncharacterized protein LOC107264209 [Cephus cinctus]XP_024937124.1 uncharacterized protein LOC107264209 [Cephus cinctus]XP_024937125.1 uncharacterized protein LOC107264209 [Cephus cinctus]XP_024937128.1 uncharacterized protein LOC107264209 [Cephus cinctus]